MANQPRTDASSFSFGRRLVNAERDAAQAKADLADLKQSLPSNRALQAAALTGETIKQQRKLAKQTMSRADVTVEELNSIDPAVLTPAYQEQLRGKKRDMLLAQELQASPGLNINSPAALQRFENWKAQARITQPQQRDFASSNLWPEQQTPYERWDARQRSLAGRQWNAEQKRAEYSRNEQQARARFQEANKPKPQGRHIGKMKDLSDD
jgi:hypothetical protein